MGCEARHGTVELASEPRHDARDLLTDLGRGRHEVRRDVRLRHGVTSFRPNGAGFRFANRRLRHFHFPRDSGRIRLTASLRVVLQTWSGDVQWWETFQWEVERTV